MNSLTQKAMLFTLLVLAVALLATAPTVTAGELWIGSATADITPKDTKLAITGNRTVRLSDKILSPCLVNVLALESRDEDNHGDQVIIVACDLCVIRPGIQDGFRKVVADRLPGFDVNNLFLSATHTHTAPVLLQDRYESYGDAMQPKDYVAFMYQSMADAVERAWKNRKKGAVAWGLGHAVVGHNRRAAYQDGTAKMYGNTNTPDFKSIEGYEDHAVDILTFYDEDLELTATAITLAAPAQSVGGQVISADYWHNVRELIKKSHGEDVTVLGFAAPAGDQSPHLLYRKSSEERMARLRGLTRTEELGRRIAATFTDVLSVIAKDIRTDVPLVHSVELFDLPGQIVTEQEYASCKKVCDDIDAKEKMVGPDWWNRHFFGLVVDRYNAQQEAAPLYPVEMHVLRLGEVAIATNPFELYVDYGVQIQARSPAQQTFLIQLAAPLDFAYYVPTPRAVAGGGYSAEVTHNLVGPDGAEVLVERTIESISNLFPPAK